MDRLTSMQAFVAAAETGSYVTAASRLDMSSQMVAKHVAFLEARLGSRLINRTTRRQSLTELGERYLERCRVVLAEADAADAMASEAITQPRGRLRISAPLNYGAPSFMSFIQSYMNDHPLVAVELVLSDSYVDVTEDSFEAVFRVGHVLNEASTLTSRVLRPYKLIPCASPAYLAGRTYPQVPADLTGHSCISYLFMDRRHQAEWTIVSDQGERTKVAIDGRLRVNDMRASITAALGGFGIVMAAEETVQDHLRSGELVRVLPKYAGESRPLSLVYRADRQRTAKLRSFVEAAVSWFSSSSLPGK